MSITYRAILMEGQHVYDEVMVEVDGDEVPETLRRPIEDANGAPKWALYELAGKRSAPTYEYTFVGYADREPTDDTP